MIEFNFDSFLATLCDNDRMIAQAIDEHIRQCCPEYKPFDIKPKSKQGNEWVANYRKKPKVGKPICNFFSIDNKLKLQLVFLTSIVHEFLLRQNEFGEKVRSVVLRSFICKGCNGSKCVWKQYFYINKVVMTCPYPYILIEDMTEEDLHDLKLLIDMQSRHMTQNQRDIKGNSYAEITAKRCGEVDVVTLEAIGLSIDAAGVSLYTKKAERLSKYAQLYDVVPMGIYEGIWYYQSDESACGVDCSEREYCFKQIPTGRYATVTISDPLSFSLKRPWNYICDWARKNKEAIASVPLYDDVCTVCFVKFYKAPDGEYMTMYVPLK